MAAGAHIAVTPGSGDFIATGATYTEASTVVKDQKVILGENYIASYMTGATTSGISTATVASHLLQIMAGAANKIRIRRIEIHQATVTSAAALWQVGIYRLTSAGTGGIALTPAPLDPSDAASGATAMILPSSKGAEGTLIAEGIGYMMQTVAASNQMVNPIIVFDFDRPRSKPLIIAAGTANGIAVKALTGVTGALCIINVWFDESPF